MAYGYDGNELAIGPQVGFTGQYLKYSLDLRSLMIPATMKGLKAIQLCFVITGNTNAAVDKFIQTGVLFVVVDGIQNFGFEVVRNPGNVQGPTETTLTAVFPVQGNSSSIVDFILQLPNFVVGNVFAILYVNLFDFDVPPFIAPSHTVFLDPL